PLLVIADELDGLGGEALRQRRELRRLLHDLVVAYERNRRKATRFLWLGGRHALGAVIVRIRNAKVLIEAVTNRQMGRQMTEMPLADGRGAIAEPAQQLRDRDFAWMQADRIVWEKHSGQADALGITARENRGARRRAIRMRRVKRREPLAFPGEPID